MALPGCDFFEEYSGSVHQLRAYPTTSKKSGKSRHNVVKLRILDDVSLVCHSEQREESSIFPVWRVMDYDKNRARTNLIAFGMAAVEFLNLMTLARELSTDT